MRRFLGLLGILAMLASCRSPAPQTPPMALAHAQFFLESSAPNAATAVLPLSGVSVPIERTPVVTEDAINNVDLVQAELGLALSFQLAPSAIRQLQTESARAPGRRLVLFVNGRAIGMRRFDGFTDAGMVSLFIEVPESELPELVAKLKSSVAAWRQESTHRK